MSREVEVPLSEHEQQMLAQLEQALASEDPRFAHQMRGGAAFGVRRRRLAVGVLGFVLGLGLVILGVNTMMWIGAVGFAVMVAAVAFALAPTRTLDTAKDAARPAAPTKGGSGFMGRLDARWERRERGL